MYRKIVFIFVMLCLSSCTTNISSYFKRSANNKIFDTKGFQGGKRSPLYNKKYIAKAKQNVIEENFDDDDDNSDNDNSPERADPAKLNRQIYLNMLEKEARIRKNAHLTELKTDTYDKSSSHYPSLNKASDTIEQSSNNEQELQKELSEIKAMLKETKADLAKYKCPMEKKSR